MPRCGAGWRSQHEDDRQIIHCRLPAQRNRFRRPAIEQARGFLAGEGDGLRPIASNLFLEGRDVDGGFERLMVHSRAELANIGKADAEFQQIRKFMRLVPARRDAYFVDRTPKAIAAMRVVMAEVGGSLARGGADEDEAQIFLEQVRKPFQLVRALFVSAWQYPPVRFQRWMPGRSLVP
jgi:hypothetical protein